MRVAAREAAKYEEEVLREYRAYEGMKGELLEKYEGRVVAIKDGRVVGVYESEAEALEDVVKRFGLTPVLIKRVTREERPEELPSYIYGLLTAPVG